MKFSKKDWCFLVVGLVVLFLIWWFFFRNKDSESGYGTRSEGASCQFTNQCGQGLGCNYGKCAPKKRKSNSVPSVPATYSLSVPVRSVTNPIPTTPQSQPGVPTSGLTGAGLFSNEPMMAATM